MHPRLKFPLKIYVNFWPFKSLPHPTPVPFNSPHFLSPHLQFAFASLGEFLQSSPRVLLQPPPFPPQRNSSFAFPCPRAVSLFPSTTHLCSRRPSTTTSNAWVLPLGLPSSLPIPFTPNPLFPGSTYRRPEQVVQTKLPTVMST